MTFSEIIAKLSGADPAKQYNMSLEEIKENPETTPVLTTSTAPGEPQPTVTVQENSSTVELDKLNKTIQEQAAAIEELKKANMALLSRTPTKAEPNIDELILQFAGYQLKEDEYANG